jgi:large subunit ribosomal protein L23
MNQERIFKILLGPHISEKSTVVSNSSSNSNVVFRVIYDANKSEIKKAVETLFKVKVKSVRVLNIKGKTKKTRFGIGRSSSIRKAYVRLMSDYNIDFLNE